MTSAETSGLRPNGLGGYIVRQSDLASWTRCNLQKHYQDLARDNPDADQPEALSATEYGSVVHYAVLVLEQAMLNGEDDPVGQAVATFEYYWKPENIEQLPGGARRVTVWLPRQTYGGLRIRGREVIRDVYERRHGEDSVLLALEYKFAVPLMVKGRVHTFQGQIDRLALRKSNRKPYLSVEDNKTGRQPRSLRWNVQGSAYCYATWLPEFWLGWKLAPPEHGVVPFPPEDVERLEKMFGSHGWSLTDEHQVLNNLPMAPRRFRWLNLQEMKDADGGWRSERDFGRLELAVDAYVRANEAGIFMPSMVGDICQYCPWQLTCGGIGIADEEEGKP